jgi:hypothetical protein
MRSKEEKVEATKNMFRLLNRKGRPVTETVAIKAYLMNIAYIPFVWVMQYLNLNGEVIALFAVMLGMDLVTGLGKTVAIGNKPESWRLANGIISKGVLLLIPLALAVAAKAVHMDITPLLYMVIDALILSELYSVIGNIYTIRTKKQIPEYDVLSKILKAIRNAIDKMLGDGDHA